MIDVSERRLAPGQRARHWDTAYERRGSDGVSWYQETPRVSLELIDALSIAKDAAIIDVGGGASLLAERLAARGFDDVTVLDLSLAALAQARKRAGASSPVRWLQDDLLVWEPQRRYDLWHDRAVLHFLVEPEDRAIYVAKLHDALQSHGAVIVGAFAPDGPQRCSGLPVVRYSATQLALLLGARFSLVETRREEHVTPSGVRQPFTWIAARLDNRN